MRKKYDYALVSGGFDPVHVGHLRMFKDAKKLSDEVVLLLNNDDWLIKKKGKPFMSESQRKEILDELKNIGLNSQLHTSPKKLSKDTDIYIVDTYGETAKFYSLSKLTFLGGSLIPHGGQNPLESAREGNYILYGPNIENFKEVYEMLEKLKITTRVNSIKNMKSVVRQKINFLQRNTVHKKLKYLGDKILNKNLYEIKKFI